MVRWCCIKSPVVCARIFRTNHHPTSSSGIGCQQLRDAGLCRLNWSVVIRLYAGLDRICRRWIIHCCPWLIRRSFVWFRSNHLCINSVSSLDRSGLEDVDFWTTIKSLQLLTTYRPIDQSSFHTCLCACLQPNNHRTTGNCSSSPTPPPPTPPPAGVPKTPKTSGKPSRQCLFQWPATGIVASGAGRHGWAPTNSDKLCGDGMCAREMRVRACGRDVFAQYDNNISPSLIVLLIKIIILYFIRHTDDFPSTGTRLVLHL